MFKSNDTDPGKGLIIVELPKTLHKESRVRRSEISNAEAALANGAADNIPFYKAVVSARSGLALPEEASADPVDRFTHPDWNPERRTKEGGNTREDRIK